MIFCAIHLDHRVVSPARAVLIQLLHQTTQKLAKVVLVRVGLEYGQVAVAEVIQGDDHADSGSLFFTGAKVECMLVYAICGGFR